MSKVITFSSTFPSYHPRAGEPTDFVSKIWQSLYNQEIDFGEYTSHEALEKELSLFVAPVDFNPKHHTIRAGHRWKEGDWFSPRVWSGKPYNSKQIQFAPDIQIKKIWNFDVDPWESYVINSKPLCYSEFKAVALNDGFTAGDDLELWLNVKRGEAFNGQIICWNENIEY
jgi:hypothetical protein